MENLLGALAGLALVLFVVLIVIYVAQAIFLNKLNKLIYGKGTAMAWIPMANLYLLGKLTVNKIVGWILVICPFLTGTTTTTINGVETTSTFLPEKLNSLISTIHSFAVLALFAFAVIKYINLKKEVNNSSENELEETPEPIAQTVTNTVVQPIQQPVQQPIEQPIQETITETIMQPAQQPIENPVNTESANVTPAENNEQDPFQW